MQNFAVENEYSSNSLVISLKVSSSVRKVSPCAAALFANVRKLMLANFTELWRLDLFSCTSSSFLCAGTLSPRGKCCYFCGRFSWSRQTSLSKGFSYYLHDSTTELYFRPATHQCRCYSKTKTTKYCLKHEGKSHPCHPWQN